MDERTEQEIMEDKLKQCIDDLMDKRWVPCEDANTDVLCLSSV